mmetsp:Transcript_39698/g.123673  ORF Transcript_39698/g.123673 Transcript_39698/m.123673 type:complete len:460 (-) Transcript_39698:874-2253(-)
MATKVHGSASILEKVRPARPIDVTALCRRSKATPHKSKARDSRQQHASDSRQQASGSRQKGKWLSRLGLQQLPAHGNLAPLEAARWRHLWVDVTHLDRVPPLRGAVEGRALVHVPRALLWPRHGQVAPGDELQHPRMHVLRTVPRPATQRVGAEHGGRDCWRCEPLGFLQRHLPQRLAVCSRGRSTCCAFGPLLPGCRLRLPGLLLCHGGVDGVHALDDRTVEHDLVRPVRDVHGLREELGVGGARDAAEALRIAREGSVVDSAPRACLRLLAELCFQDVKQLSGCLRALTRASGLCEQLLRALGSPIGSVHLAALLLQTIGQSQQGDCLAGPVPEALEPVLGAGCLAQTRGDVARRHHGLGKLDTRERNRGVVFHRFKEAYCLVAQGDRLLVGVVHWLACTLAAEELDPVDNGSGHGHRCLQLGVLPGHPVDDRPRSVVGGHSIINTARDGLRECQRP